MTNELILPFKPFTLDEVKHITGVSANVLDKWTGLDDDKPLHLHRSGGVVGLDYMQTFAVFVGWKYIGEGADKMRSRAAVEAVANISRELMLQEFMDGHSFLALSCQTGLSSHMFIEPPNSRMGRALDCARLWREFENNIAKVFPDYKPSAIGIVG